MFRSVFVACALFLGLVAFPATSSAEEDQPTATEKISWGRLHTRFLDDGSSVTEARTAQPEADALAFEPAPVDWPSFEASQKVMAAFNVSPFDITAVQAVVPINADGSRGDSTEVVITSTGTDYFYVPSTGTVTSTPPKGFLTGQGDLYGYSVEKYPGSGECVWSEWLVDFWMPMCMRSYGDQFSGTPGIVDAWAPNPPCGSVNGGVCAGWQCGPAWTAPCEFGYQCWYNFLTCDRAARTTAKVGRQVQKRWLFSWRNYGRSDTDIARSVRVRIRY